MNKNHEAISIIKKKLTGSRLSYHEVFTLMDEIVNKRLGPIPTSYFAAAGFQNGFSRDELYYLTKAMVETGKKLHFTGIVADKHSTGGVAGTRTTMIVVPVVAAAGYLIPKNSSRAITAAAGTADTMEFLAKVTFSIKQIETIVHKTGGCIVWGGHLGIAPADDIIIQVEEPMMFESYDKIIVSIMAKKVASSATHLVLDIPVGPYMKIKYFKDADTIARKFTELGKRFNMKMTIDINEKTRMTLSPEETSTPMFFLFTQTPNMIAIQNTNKDIIRIHIPVEQIQDALSIYTFTPPSSLPASLSVRIPKVSVTEETGVYTASSLSSIPCVALIQKSPQATSSTTVDPLSSVLSVSVKNTTHCLETAFNRQTLKSGYLLTATTKTISGLPLELAVINKSVDLEDVRIRLQSLPSFTTDYIVIPPSYPYGEGKSIMIKNISYNNDTSTHELKHIAMWFIPYSFVSSFVFTPKTVQTAKAIYVPQSLCHIRTYNAIYYRIDCPQKTASSSTLLLSQSYDPGWHAYIIHNAECTMQDIGCRMKNWLSTIFPFVFGKEIKNHIVVNNWENGWIIDSKTLGLASLEDNTTSNLTVLPSQNLTISLFFLPQLLEWIGFLLLPLPFMMLFLKKSTFAHPK